MKRLLRTLPESDTTVTVTVVVSRPPCELYRTGDITHKE